MSIVVEHKNKVVLIRLNRPEALNALNSETLRELLDVMEPLDQDSEVGCFVITGSEKAFAAGADIREMASKSFTDMFHEDFFAGWERFASLRTPKIAAVNGYALGGGCELAMMCDTLYASETAWFGQPEVKLGVIPGIGGTQRLTRMIGRSKAMDMILTGKRISAEDAESAGLVARVFPSGDLVEETLKIAESIAQLSQPSIMMAREAVNQAEELSLCDGLKYERRMFHSLFATHDQKEGMSAFLQKREPDFRGV